MTRRHVVVRWLAALGLILAFVSTGTLDAKGSGKGGRGKAAHAKSASKAPKAAKQPAVKLARASAPRDAKGKIQRGDAARHAFARQTGYPHGRPGYVIDHLVPLACGGADAPSNMQWQTVAEAKAKDRVERIGCR
jgi:hypothetical protein